MVEFRDQYVLLHRYNELKASLYFWWFWLLNRVACLAGHHRQNWGFSHSNITFSYNALTHCLKYSDSFCARGPTFDFLGPKLPGDPTCKDYVLWSCSEGSRRCWIPYRAHRPQRDYCRSGGRQHRLDFGFYFYPQLDYSNSSLRGMALYFWLWRNTLAAFRFLSLIFLLYLRFVI